MNLNLELASAGRDLCSSRYQRQAPVKANLYRMILTTHAPPVARSQQPAAAPSGKFLHRRRLLRVLLAAENDESEKNYRDHRANNTYRVHLRLLYSCVTLGPHFVLPGRR